MGGAGSDRDDDGGSFYSALDVVRGVDGEGVRLDEAGEAVDEVDAISPELVSDHVVLGVDDASRPEEQILGVDADTSDRTAALDQ